MRFELPLLVPILRPMHPIKDPLMFAGQYPILLELLPLDLGRYGNLFPLLLNPETPELLLPIGQPHRFQIQLLLLRPHNLQPLILDTLNFQLDGLAFGDFAVGGVALEGGLLWVLLGGEGLLD
jgi:hypothetical protein